jgi:hypothetical protein
VWWKRAAAIASSASLLLGGAGCRTVPAPKSGPRPAQISRRLDASDLLPVDLDVVVRVDMARLKAGLGPGIADALAARASERGGEGFVSEAIAKADAVWIGLRLADIDAGDRVLVAEGHLGDVHIEPSDWKETTPAMTREGMQVLDRQVPPLRAGTGRIVAYSGKLYAFVSPVEVDATSRLLRDGPDAGRGDPSAEGLVSVDVRGHRLPPSLEKKYPSIAAVIAGISRVRGSASLADDGLRVTADITAKSADAAARVEKFLATLRDGAAGSAKYGDMMKTVQLERTEAHVHLAITVPAQMVIAALTGPPAGKR